MDEDFKDWAYSYAGIKKLPHEALYWMNAAWLEASRRADKRARDGLKDIANIDYNGQSLELKYFADRTESQTLERALLSAESTLRKVEKAIRATIKEG